jgi:hypothetical protein
MDWLRTQGSAMPKRLIARDNAVSVTNRTRSKAEELGELGAGVVEDFYDLDGPIVRITTPHIPLPAADALDDLTIPSVERIVSTIQKSMRGITEIAERCTSGKLSNRVKSKK